MKKALLFLLFFVFVPNFAKAETVYKDKQIGFEFQDKYGDFTYDQVLDYTKQSPGLGKSVKYVTDNSVADIYIYNMGLDAITTEQLIAMYQAARDDIYEMKKRGRYQDVELQTEGVMKVKDKEVVVGQFRLKRNDNNLVSLLWLWEQNNYFMKIRYTCFEAAGDVCKNGFDTLQAFVETAIDKKK